VMERLVKRVSKSMNKTHSYGLLSRALRIKGTLAHTMDCPSFFS
jgi:hypothetical protein